MDRNKIKERLASLKQKGSGKKLDTSDILKLENGDTTVRIVPLKQSPEFPFIETYWHYNMNKKSYLSPHTYGDADPILEFSIDSQEAANGNTEDWKAAKKLEPKLRVFAPVIVRGKESEGVKFWSFGVNLYQELLGYLDDDEYDDIADLEKGTDIVISKKSPEEAGNTYGETSIRLKRKTSPVAPEDMLDEVLEIISNQKEISEIDYFKPATYDELSDALTKLLNVSDAKDDTPSPTQASRVASKGDDSSETVDMTQTDNPETKNKFNDIFKKKG